MYNSSDQRERKEDAKCWGMRLKVHNNINSLSKNQPNLCWGYC